MVLRDRKAEFQLNVILPSSSRIHFTESESSRILNLNSVLSEYRNAAFISTFLKRVEDINARFTSISRNISDAIAIQTALLEFSKTDDRLYSTYKNIKNDLVHIAKEMKDLENLFDVKRFKGLDTELRIINTQIITLKKRLSTSISYYYSIQEEYRNKCKAQVKRQAVIAGADISKLNFDEVVGSKTDIFLRTVLPDYDLAHHYLEEIKKRHEMFMRMEKTIDDLRDLFFDLALVIQIDYALIDRIDKHTNAVDKIVSDAKSTVIAYRQFRRTNRLKLPMSFVLKKNNQPRNCQRQYHGEHTGSHHHQS